MQSMNSHDVIKYSMLDIFVTKRFVIYIQSANIYKENWKFNLAFMKSGWNDPYVS